MPSLYQKPSFLINNQAFTTASGAMSNHTHSTWMGCQDSCCKLQLKNERSKLSSTAQLTLETKINHIIFTKTV
eukprot:m.343223 g.343223  ORF g.343223 m.343223 type:complete len:73 (-) comp22536_c0_seq1:91-309(-)